MCYSYCGQELFKKTLPSAAAAGFVQVGVNREKLLTKAAKFIAEAPQRAGPSAPCPRLIMSLQPLALSPSLGHGYGHMHRHRSAPT